MARIPRLNGQRVSPATLPGATLGVRQQAFAPTQPFRQLAEIGEDVGGIAYQEERENQRKIAKAQAEANQVASQEFLNKATVKEVELKTAMSAVKGREAGKAAKDALTAFDKWYAEESKNVTDDDLRRRYQGHYSASRASLESDGIRYAAQEFRNFDNEKNQALVENESRAGVDAWYDPDRVNLAIARIAGAHESFAARNGMPSEWADAETHKVVAKLRTGVVSRMLSAGKVAEARDFFTKNERGFQDPDSVRKALEKDQELEEVQAAVDRAIQGTPEAAGGGVAGGVAGGLPAKDEDEALARMNSLFTGRKRELARDLVKERYADLARAEDRRQESLYESIVKRYDADPSQDPRKVDPVGFESLPVKYRDAITNRYAKEQKNDGLFLGFMSKPLDEVADYSPARFEAEVWSKLPDKQRNEARTRWTQAVDAKGKPDRIAAFNGNLSDEQMIFKAAQEFGIGGITKEDTLESVKKDEKVNDKKKAALLEWRESLYAALQAYHATTNKNADDKAKKEMIYNLVEKRYLGGDDTPTYRVTPADEFQKSLFVPYDAIKPDDRATIENYIKNRGGIVTQEKVSRIYAAFKMGNKALVQAILKE